ncbi:Addiction module toxin, RelE/StbE family [Streptococcus gallolyticus]|uniref:Addiction module toxin, RelE/StbE family n=1 Tax=Streptococcus gallolyticus TaxID=315405 RepID=A0A060RIS2_9STRE|nr:type II toxin-antitoxin system RelE/ParE family toxin [Streptococcus gallolyticus]CDO18871.1 Addiction module toxin, RelE/StbE family [Streptococcus gallolyticus]SDJ90181.1 mRNA interferase RelE/StbE [Streptococcus gallolyticus]SDL39538.1 mRNA interferase RelE/StbE [Streptococcus gallolyticus]
MTYRLVVSDKVKKQLKKMDKHVRLMLAKDMKKHLDGVENPRQTGKALTGQFKGLWRYRIGNYRVICDIIDDDLVVLAIEVGHRKDIYKN